MIPDQKDDVTLERQLRESSPPKVRTLWQLFRYIWTLRKYGGDYGTAVYAISLASTATFSYMARHVGATGFQASCADLDIIRRTRHCEGPFMLVRLEDYLYPQYDLHAKLQGFIDENRDWIIEQAASKLANDTQHAAPSVLKHWERLAAEAEQ